MHTFSQPSLLPSYHRNGKRMTARRRRIQISLLSAVLNSFIRTRKMSLLYQVLKTMPKKLHDSEGEES